MVWLAKKCFLKAVMRTKPAIMRIKQNIWSLYVNLALHNLSVTSLDTTIRWLAVLVTNKGPVNVTFYRRLDEARRMKLDSVAGSALVFRTSHSRQQRHPRPVTMNKNAVICGLLGILTRALSVAGAPVVCRDASGKAVDWWIMLKKPAGSDFAYIDSNQKDPQFEVLSIMGLDNLAGLRHMG
jgi:Deoxyribonuclease II